MTKNARTAAALDRQAWLKALVAADVIGQRRAALRVWASSGRLLTLLDVERHHRARATAAQWQRWAELSLVSGTIEPELAAAAQHHQYHQQEERQYDR